jgi:hypothetical protein
MAEFPASFNAPELIQSLRRLRLIAHNLEDNAALVIFRCLLPVQKAWELAVDVRWEGSLSPAN